MSHEGSDYNYRTFPPDDDVDAFRNFASHLQVGSHGGDPLLTGLKEQTRARLSDFTDKGITVVEFGSLT